MTPHAKSVYSVRCMVNTPPPRFSTRLQRILWEERIKQVRLAEAAGINEGRLSQYINGRMQPGQVNRKKIADALGRSDQAETLFLPDVSNGH